MNRYLFPIKSIERVNKKSKKNDVVNKDNTKSPTNDIIISLSLFSDKHYEIALPS